MLTLSSQQPFATGGRRVCYVHPDRPDRCVKVLRQDRPTSARLSNNSWVPARWRRAYDNNADEQGTLEALQRRLGCEVTARHLPVCHGICETDLGPGLELDLIRDFDGGEAGEVGPIARDLRYYARSSAPVGQFRPAFDEFGAWLLEHRVLTRMLHDHNLVAQKQADGGWRLVLIDGIGDRAWIPVRRWIKTAARRSVQQRLLTGWSRIEERFGAAAHPPVATDPAAGGPPSISRS